MVVSHSDTHKNTYDPFLRLQIVPILLPTTIVAVLAGLLGQEVLGVSIKSAAAAKTGVRGYEWYQLASAAKTALESLTAVATQFASNLVAVGLSEVISNSTDVAWVLWFVAVAIAMLYVAAQAISTS